MVGDRFVRVPRGVLVVGALAAALAPSGHPSVSRADATVLSDGHVDYAARMVSGQFRSQIKDATKGADQVVWRDPSDVLFKVNKAARTTVPSDPSYAFLGPAGSSTWMIPQVQKAGILWAGWNTEELSSSDVSGPVVWKLLAVQGPGTFAIFQSGTFGAVDVVFDSSDGLPDQRSVALGVHAHANWAFSQPGNYQLTFEMAATRPNGEPVADTRVLPVLVEADAAGDPPGSPSDPSAPGTSPGTTSPFPPAGQPGSPSSPAGAAAKLSLVVGTARLKRRTLSFRMRLSHTSRLDVAVKHNGRVVTRARARTVAGSRRARTLRVLLGRSLKPGRTYRATIRVRAGGATVTRTLTVRVGRAR